jgi:phage shock protein E
MRILAIVIALLTYFTYFTYGINAASAQPAPPVEAPSIEPVELNARRAAGTAPVVIDVRTEGEFEAGHIPGALNIPFDEVAERISEVDAPNGVALYCMMGPRARKGELALLGSGYTSVLHIEGGLAAWKGAGLPVEGVP